jgi:hypothetical protein
MFLIEAAVLRVVEVRLVHVALGADPDRGAQHVLDRRVGHASRDPVARDLA